MKKTYLSKKKLKAQPKNQTSYNNNAPKGRNKKLDATQRDLNFLRELGSTTEDGAKSTASL